MASLRYRGSSSNLSLILVTRFFFHDTFFTRIFFELEHIPEFEVNFRETFIFGSMTFDDADVYQKIGAKRFRCQVPFTVFLITFLVVYRRCRRSGLMGWVFDPPTWSWSWTSSTRTPPPRAQRQSDPSHPSMLPFPSVTAVRNIGCLTLKRPYVVNWICQDKI